MSAITDMGDPIRHDVTGERATQGIIARSLAWIALQPKERQALSCEHGSYIGYQGALRFKCPRCDPEGKL